jgi:putative transcriptional regulator
MSLAGSFLIAQHTLRDPNFAHTVVLLLAHGEEGAFGLVVNRPAQAEGLPWPVFDGGPCPSPGLLMLHGHAGWASAGDAPDGENVVREAGQGIFVGDAACLERASEEKEGEAARFRVFTGYAGWGPGQLEDELASGAWGVTPATGDLLFDTPADELWDRLAPPRIPQPSVN